MRPAAPQLAAPLPAAPSPAANQLPAANYIDEQRGPGIGDVLTAPSQATHQEAPVSNHILFKLHACKTKVLAFNPLD